MIALYFVVLFSKCMNAVNLYDYEDQFAKPTSTTELQFEPIVPVSKNKEKVLASLKNLDCDAFPQYALNCTIDAALIYNSTKKAPPKPHKLNMWCKAIRHLKNCAIDWNSDCKDVTDNHFNEESIKGHMHVVENICDDEWFLHAYDTLSYCISGVSVAWESCYVIFKKVVDEQKNTTREWTHFITHFYLCCARAQFRRCTLDLLFSTSQYCNLEQATTLQKFSVIVSMGDVFQDCDQNVMYSNCPDGDPRPTDSTLKKLMNFGLPESFGMRIRANLVFTCILSVIVLIYCIIK